MKARVRGADASRTSPVSGFAARTMTRPRATPRARRRRLADFAGVGIRGERFVVPRAEREGFARIGGDRDVGDADFGLRGARVEEFRRARGAAGRRRVRRRGGRHALPTR